MRFFEVLAKCGHCGRGKYYSGRFYVKAENGKAAATIVRQKPRVKHDHKYAIQKVTEIKYTEYIFGQAQYFANPYFKCKNIQEQRLHLDVIIGSIVPEMRQERENDSDKDRQSKLRALRKLRRKMDKHYNNNYYKGA